MVSEFKIVEKLENLTTIENFNQNSYVFIFHNDKILCRNSNLNENLPKYVQSSTEMSFSPFLQYDWRAFEFAHYQEKLCILIYLKNEVIADSKEYQFKELRSFFFQNPNQWLIIAGLAGQIYRWDKNHTYCGRCGAMYQLSIREIAKKCTKCGHILYPQISPAIIVLIQKEGKFLLANNTRFNENLYSLIAGFVNVGETLEECVIREVKEEVGLTVENMQYVKSQPWPFPSSLMLGFIADWKEGEIKCDGKEINDARWFSKDELATVILPSQISIARQIIQAFISNHE